MSYVYILHSLKLDRFYVGSCLNLEERLQVHLNKIDPTSYTAKSDDWTLFFSIQDLSYHQARSIEAHIKSMRSRKYYSNLRSYPELVEKLKAQYK